MNALRLGLGGLVFLGIAVVSAATVRSAEPDSDPLAPARAILTASRATLIAQINKAKTHSDDAYDIVSRLDDALGSLNESLAKSDPVYAADVTLEASLDKELVDQIISGTCNTIPSTPGAYETCFTSSTDKTLQPLAIVVPTGYHAPAPAVVVLHGRGESEANLASYHGLRQLADSTSTVVAIPYARGRMTYDAAATQDVLDATDAMTKALAIDAKRIYLAGFSAGGYATFHVAAAAPNRYAAILDLAGALTTTDSDSAAAALRDRRVYIVAGARDDVVLVQNPRNAARYLHSKGVEVSYYEQTDGVHSWNSLNPAISSAWHDMLKGVPGPFTLEHDGVIPSGTAPPTPQGVEPVPGPKSSTRP